MRLYLTLSNSPESGFPAEADRVFGLRVLRRLDAELIQRGDAYRKSAGRATIALMTLTLDGWKDFFPQDTIASHKQPLSSSTGLCARAQCCGFS